MYKLISFFVFCGQTFESISYFAMYIIRELSPIRPELISQMHTTASSPKLSTWNTNSTIHSIAALTAKLNAHFPCKLLTLTLY